MYENALPQELWAKPQNIRVLKLAFDEVKLEDNHFVLYVFGTQFASIRASSLDEKTRSKLYSLQGV